ncbi:hypothetical protein ACHMWN_04295 [Pedobacter sp. UC225_61]|uniref:hypothetical protein n=1 Tax=Pedobacter sp. UC225_61 TaxID=3374623 RepID=UPI0037B388D4
MNLNKNILSGQELWDRLNQEDWAAIIPKLHYYSLNRLQRFDFLHSRYDVKNLSAQFADEAIRMVWEQERKWNTNYYTDLYVLLKGIVDSLHSNFLHLKETEITEALPEDQETIVSQLASDPEHDYIIKEIEIEIAKILKDDAEAMEIFDCLKNGLKPREISAELDIEIEHIYNIIKRMQRKLKKYDIN